MGVTLFVSLSFKLDHLLFLYFLKLCFLFLEDFLFLEFSLIVLPFEISMDTLVPSKYLFSNPLISLGMIFFSISKKEKLFLISIFPIRAFPYLIFSLIFNFVLIL